MCVYMCGEKDKPVKERRVMELRCVEDINGIYNYICTVHALCSACLYLCFKFNEINWFVHSLQMIAL